MVGAIRRLRSSAAVVVTMFCFAPSCCDEDEASVGAPTKSEQLEEKLSPGQITSVVSTNQIPDHLRR
jgi:hypothetical protein